MSVATAPLGANDKGIAISAKWRREPAAPEPLDRVTQLFREEIDEGTHLGQDMQA